MDELNAPKKVVDGLTEVFEGLARMFEGISEQLELMGVAPEEKAVFPVSEDMTSGMDKPVAAVSGKKGTTAPHPRKTPGKKTGKTEGVTPDKPKNTDADTEPSETQPDAEGSEDEGITDAVSCESSEKDTGQKENTGQQDEPPDTAAEPAAVAEPPEPSDTGKPPEPGPVTPPNTQPAVTITKDDITAVIVAKIKKKRDNNEKIGQLLKAYGCRELSALPSEKYEAFLADISQL